MFRGQYRSILEYKNLLLVLNKLFTCHDVKTQEHTDLDVFGWDPEPDSYGQASISTLGVKNSTLGSWEWCLDQAASASPQPNKPYASEAAMEKPILECSFSYPSIGFTTHCFKSLYS